MKNYLLILFALAAFSGALLCLFERARVIKHLRYLAALVLLIAAVLPLKNLIFTDVAQLFSLSATEAEIENGYPARLCAECSGRLRAYLLEQIAAKTDLGEDDLALEVEMRFENDELSVSRIVVRLRSFAAVYARGALRDLLDDYESVSFIEEL